MKKLAALYLLAVVALTAAIIYVPSALSRMVEREEADAAVPEGMVEALPVIPADLPPEGSETAAALAAVAAGDEPRSFPVVRGGKASLDQTTSAILADLAIVQTSAGADGQTGTDADAELAAMSTAAIAGLKGARGQGGDRVETLETLVAKALLEGRPDTEIDALVNAAAGAGTVSVPAELVTPEGRVDTAILLASLVSQAQIAAGVAEPVDPSTVVAGGQGVEVHLVPQADGTSSEAQFYTVGKGDSLGAIARRFYGDAVLYSAIFEANRGILSSPDRLSVGQRLMIPNI